MQWSLKKRAAVLSLCIAMPAVSCAETLVCTVKPTNPRIDRIPTELTAKLDPTRSFVLVTDNVGGRADARPVRAEVTRDDGQRLMFNWELHGLAKSNVRNSAIVYGHTARYRATLRSSGELVLNVQTNPWNPHRRTKGQCTRVPG